MAQENITARDVNHTTKEAPDNPLPCPISVATPASHSGSDADKIEHVTIDPSAGSGEL